MFVQCDDPTRPGITYGTIKFEDTKSVDDAIRVDITRLLYSNYKYVYYDYMSTPLLTYRIINMYIMIIYLLLYLGI